MALDGHAVWSEVHICTIKMVIYKLEKLSTLPLRLWYGVKWKSTQMLLLQWRWSPMAWNESNFRGVLSVEKFGRVLLLLFFLSFPPVPVFFHACYFLRSLNVSVEQLIQFTFWIFTPIWKQHPVPCAFMCVCCKARTITRLRRALAHVHFTEVKIFVRVHSVDTFPKDAFVLDL